MMASTELSQGLMDIITSLTQEEIPFKLRCAICNNLAINAFRLPCCDQAICESCQTSLPESCPVCEHNPVSPDLCKPNKALRTTLKAFLRTEEKKREKDRPLATPTTDAAPTPTVNATVETHDNVVISMQKTSDNAQSTEDTSTQPLEADGIDKLPNGQNGTEAAAPALVKETEVLAAPVDENGISNAETNAAPADAEALDSNGEPRSQSDMTSFNEPNQMMTPNMGFGMMPGMMPPMGWSGQDFGTPMTQFMPGAMGNFQNTMGMPGMGSMTGAQGMFGGYGMNMNNMGNDMNMGFGAEQQMYNNWDSSHNNMYNPNAFSNGMSQDYGTSGYAGYMSQPNGNYSQMQQQYPNQNYQNGYYGNGQGYMRGGMGRGRGRGYYRGRGGYDGRMNANHYSQNYPNNVSQGPMDQPTMGQTEDDLKKFNDELAPGGEGDLIDGPPKDSTTTLLTVGPEDEKAPETADSTDQTDKQVDVNINSNGEPARPEESASASQLQGIPTIDSIDSAPSHQMGYSKAPMPIMDKGYGRGRGYNRGGFINHRGGFYNNPQQGPAPPSAGQGVVGAPLAPRAMREGLSKPSTRGRLHINSRRTASISELADNEPQSATPTTAQESVLPQSPSIVERKARSPSIPREESRSVVSHPQSHPQSRPHSRPRSPLKSPTTLEPRYPRDYRRDRSESVYLSESNKDRKDRSRRSRHDKENKSRSRSRSPSQTEGSRRSSHHPDKDRDRKSSHRSYKSRRHRSRSESRNRGRGSTTLETNGGERYDLASRIANAQRLSKDSSSRHEKSARKRDREEHDKHHGHDHETDRDIDRDRDRDRDEDRRRNREKHRDRDHGREREREREKDRKRSRRDCSPSAEESDTSHRHSRRSKRSHRDGHDNEKDRSDTKSGGASSKDPHTLDREARNRERLMKEQQRRDAMTLDRDGKGSRRQHDRNVSGGRRLNYKYEDRDDMTRVEEEREASRWA